MVELVWSVERSITSTAGPVQVGDMLLLLDGGGLRRLSMPVPAESEALQVAVAAGPRSAVHDLGRPALGLRPHPLSARVYPPHKDCRRLVV